MRGDITRGLWRGSRTFRGLNARYRRRINAAVADGWCWRAEAKGEAESGDGHSTTPTQSAAEYREYELIWLMQQRLPAVSWPHWRLCCMQPRGDPSACHASRALRVLSSCVMCLAPPAVDLLEALRRCVRTRRACCFGSESPLRAPYRSNRWNGGHAIGHRRATESCREQLLQGGTRKRRYFRCNCTDPRRLKALARRTQELLATAPQILHAAQLSSKEAT